MRDFRKERQDFCNERLKIIKGENSSRRLDLPSPLNEGAKIVVHVIPSKAFDSAANCDLSLFNREYYNFPPIGASRLDHGQNNSYGFVACTKRNKAPILIDSYLQVFHKGCIESVDTSMLTLGDPLVIPSVKFKNEVKDGLLRYLSLEKQLGVEPPVFILISLLKILGYKWVTDHPPSMATPSKIDEILLLESKFDTLDYDKTKVSEIMELTFNNIVQRIEPGY